MLSRSRSTVRGRRVGDPSVVLRVSYRSLLEIMLLKEGIRKVSTINLLYNSSSEDVVVVYLLNPLLKNILLLYTFYYNSVVVIELLV